MCGHIARPSHRRIYGANHDRGILLLAAVLTASPVATQGTEGCRPLPDHGALQRRWLAQAQANGGLASTGTVVDRDGVVSNVVFTGPIAPSSGLAAA
jgi:hypothetical protein